MATERSSAGDSVVANSARDLVLAGDVVRGAIALATVGAGSVLVGREAAAAAASGAGRTGYDGPASDRHRVAIVGAGAGGVAAAYFLAGAFDVDLFEARSKIGGHCDSHVIDYRGQRLTVDLPWSTDTRCPS